MRSTRNNGNHRDREDFVEIEDPEDELMGAIDDDEYRILSVRMSQK